MSDEVISAWISAGGTVAAAVLLLGGGFLSYRHQKAQDRKADLLAKRRDIYRDLLVAISRSMNLAEKGPDADAAYRKSKSEVFVFGSDAVIKATKELSDQLESHTPSTSQTQLVAFAKLVHAMRRDSFESSRLTVDELSKLTPFTAKPET